MRARARRLGELFDARLDSGAAWIYARPLFLLGVGFAVYGAFMLLAPAGTYAGAGFRPAFEWMPRQAWGAAMVASGSIAAARPGRLGTVLLVSGVATWALFLVRGAFEDGAGWGGWLPWLVAVVQVFVALGARGAGPRP